MRRSGVGSITVLNLVAQALDLRLQHLAREVQVYHHRLPAIQALRMSARATACPQAPSFLLMRRRSNTNDAFDQLLRRKCGAPRRKPLMHDHGDRCLNKQVRCHDILKSALPKYILPPPGGWGGGGHDLQMSVVPRDALRYPAIVAPPGSPSQSSRRPRLAQAGFLVLCILPSLREPPPALLAPQGLLRLCHRCKLLAALRSPLFLLLLPCLFLLRLPGNLELLPPAVEA
jgi:hypothetical protein